MLLFLTANKQDKVMALGWLALLKTVPWTDVISAAPQVAGGARRLWEALSNKSATERQATLNGEAPPVPVTVRMEKNEAAIAALHGQMLSASELIAKLADQNTLLVARIENFRVRLLWLTIATALASISAVAALIVAMR